VQTPDGKSDFHALEKALKASTSSARLVYFVFDLLYIDGFESPPRALDRPKARAGVGSFRSARPRSAQRASCGRPSP